MNSALPNAIMGMSEGLMDEVFGSLNRKQHSSLATIYKSGEHLLELINDILDVAKIGKKCLSENAKMP